MMSVVVNLQHFKWIVPGFVIVGTAPCYLAVWGAWRLLSAALPYRIYQQGDDTLWAIYQRLVLFFFETYSGTEVHLYGDVDSLFKKKENVIYISNHQSTVDWIVINMLAVRQGMVGHIRYVLKDSLKYLPMYGFYFRQHGCIYVKRDGKFSKNQHTVERQLKRFKNENTPVWMVVFPEGTRFNPNRPEIIQKSKQFAKERGLHDYEYVLAPRMRGFKISLEHLWDHIDAVYDVTIAYSHTVDPDTGKRMKSPGMPGFLSTTNPELHIYIKRIEVHEVPRTEDSLKVWMNERFKEKDLLLSSFYGTNNKGWNLRFPGHSVISRLNVRHTLPSFLLCCSLLVFSLMTEVGTAFYWQVALYGSITGCCWMTLTT